MQKENFHQNHMDKYTMHSEVKGIRVISNEGQRLHSRGDDNGSSSRTRDTHTYCGAFSSGAVTTCFYDLGLSWLGFEHITFRLQGERSRSLRHRTEPFISKNMN